MPTLASLFGGAQQGGLDPKLSAQPTLESPKIPEGQAGSNRYGETEAAQKPLTDQLAGKSLTQVLKTLNPEADPQAFMQQSLTQDEKTGAFVAKIRNESVYFKSDTNPPTPDSLVVVPLKSLAPGAQGQKAPAAPEEQINAQTGMNPMAFGGAR